MTKRANADSQEKEEGQLGTVPRNLSGNLHGIDRPHVQKDGSVASDEMGVVPHFERRPWEMSTHSSYTLNGNGSESEKEV